MDHVAAILLAAGRSRRMGAFKALLPFGNTSVIEQCIANLRGAGIQDIVIVTGHRAADIRNQLKNEDVQFAHNSDPDSEMSVSIARGVEKIEDGATAVLITLVDHPAVRADIIRQLVDEWRKGEAKLVQPEYEGRGGHPVLIDLLYRDELLKLDPERGLRGLVEQHLDKRLRLPVGSPFVARDMDTWEDYEALHEEVFGAPPKDV